MLKRILSISTVVALLFALVGCSDGDSNTDDGSNDDTIDAEEENIDRPFVESEGLVRYLTIDDIRIAIPETVKEYQKYLNEVGTKVELLSSPNSDEAVDMDGTLEAGNQSSLKAFFKVYTDSENYHKFGVHYVNNTKEDITIGEATIDKIVLYYDTFTPEGESEPQAELMEIDTITCVTSAGDIVLDGDTKSKYIFQILGNPIQNMDGYLKYTDDLGYTYVFATSNQKGFLTQVEIQYP